MESVTAPAEAREYLCVDRFIRTLVDAQALKSAFELRLIDYLLENRAAAPEAIAGKLGIDGPGLRLLLDLLMANRVVEQDGQDVTLSRRFLEALRFRDLLEAKVDFANLVAPDFIELFTASINDPERFMRRARIFSLFDYGRCLEKSAGNIEHTKRWMRFTTALTKYEAGACLSHYAFDRHERMLDVGGNSGEFALRICGQHNGMRATVVDLPVVCEIGREHVRATPEAERISFVEGDALEEPLPAGFDLVTFKSMLHDWPEPATERLISRAWRSLVPGGTLLIFEREPIEPGGAAPSYSMIPMLLFFRAFRPASVYVEQLGRAGFIDIHAERVDVGMPFSLVTARKRPVESVT